MQIVLLFPGQGSQKPGMGKALAEAFPICRQTFEEADAALGSSLSRIIFEGPEDQLTLTENAQPAILAVSTAAGRLLESRGLTPSFLAGHSLGEFSALVAAGALARIRGSHRATKDDGGSTIIISGWLKRFSPLLASASSGSRRQPCSVYRGPTSPATSCSASSPRW